MVHGSFRTADEELTEFFDQALIALTLQEAFRMQEVCSCYVDGELEVVIVDLSYNGRPQGVSSTWEPLEPPTWKDVQHHTVAMAQAGSATNDKGDGEGGFLSHIFHVGSSPLWPLLLEHFRSEAMVKEDPDVIDGAELRLFCRGLMAGIYYERAMHGKIDVYGELLRDQDQMGGAR